MPRRSKKSLAACERERIKKKRRLETSASSDVASDDGSCYVLSDHSESESEIEEIGPVKPTLTDALPEPVSEVVESTPGPSVIEGKEPGFLTAQPKEAFQFGETTMRATYNRDSRSTKWRQQAAVRARNEEAKSCHDLRSFFSASTDASVCGYTNDAIHEQPKFPKKTRPPVEQAEVRDALVASTPTVNKGPQGSTGSNVPRLTYDTFQFTFCDNLFKQSALPDSKARSQLAMRENTSV